MKRNDVELGAVYAVKVSGTIVPVRVDRYDGTGGWFGTNQQTGRTIRIRSARRLRSLVAARPVERDAFMVENDRRYDMVDGVPRWVRSAMRGPVVSEGGA